MLTVIGVIFAALVSQARSNAYHFLASKDHYQVSDMASMGVGEEERTGAEDEVAGGHHTGLSEDGRSSY